MLTEPDVDRAVAAAATRPIAAPLERCAEFLGVDVATVRKAAAHVEPYVRVDGMRRLPGRPWPGAGPTDDDRARMRAGLELLPTWALEQKAAVNRQVIAVMRRRQAAGEDVPGAGLAWLERQAKVAEDLGEEFHQNRLSLIASIGAWGAPE
jgi:hypothetical protein